MVMSLSPHANAIIIGKIRASKAIVSNQYGVTCNLVSSFSRLARTLEGLKYQTKNKFIWGKAWVAKERWFRESSS